MDIPEFDLNIRSETVVAKPRKLREFKVPSACYRSDFCPWKSRTIQYSKMIIRDLWNI